MGQTLSIPMTTKRTSQGANDKFHYAVSEMQGWRITMEDAHTTILSLEDSEDGNAFFAVYDGHGGYNVARYAGKYVHKRLVQDKAYQEKDYSLALKNAFIGIDADMRTSPNFTADGSGCTAVAALISAEEDKIYVANAGDSRSVISVEGEAEHLSYDHKPQNENEKIRIISAGGYIEYGRVNGNLALSRALGDFVYKKNASCGPEGQIITSNPDVMEHQISEKDEFLIIACDGIWDCLSSQQAVNVVRLLISQGHRLPQICEEVCELCLAPDTTSGGGTGCDNMTMMIIAILNGRTQDEWYDWVTDRVKNKYGYPTPSTLPQLYSTPRLMSFKVKREAYDQSARQRREREARDQDQARADGRSPSSPPAEDFPHPSVFGGLANIVAGNGSLMSPTSGDDDDDDDSDDDDSHGINARSLLSNSEFGFVEPHAFDVTKSLRDQIQELGDMGAFHDNDVEMGDIDDEAGIAHEENDGEADSEHPEEELRDETPPSPPTRPPNQEEAPAQLKSLPDGDAPSAALKAEGLLDSSESPLKV